MNTASIIAPVFVYASVKRRKNTWYSMKDGNWTDPSIWQSNASKRYSYPGQNISLPIFPQKGDDVYVNHIVTINTAGLTLNNVYVSGTLKGFNPGYPHAHTINGDLIVSGTLDGSTSNTIFNLFGVNNVINNFISSGIIINYSSSINQTVLNLIYTTLSLSNQSYSGCLSIYNNTKKTLTTNFITTNFIMGGSPGTTPNSCVFELDSFDATFNAGCIVGGGSTLQKSVGGNVLFGGLLNIMNQGNSKLYFNVGNPTVECRGGIAFGYQSGGMEFLSGTGTWTFTTNNQNIGANLGYLVFSGNAAINGAITVTATDGVIYFYGSINGNNAASTLKNNNRIYFAAASPVIMTTGVLDYNYANTYLGYVMNGSYILPLLSYVGLVISNTGTKTLLGNTICTGNLEVTAEIASTTFELSTFNLQVNGTTVISNSVLSKIGAGSIQFRGLLTLINPVNINLINFSGNPAIELQNGISYDNPFSPFPSLGSGGLTLTTNNQSISGIRASGTAIINSNITISGAITVTAGSPTLYVDISGVLNGNNAGSTFDNRSLSLSYTNTTAPMAIGVLTTNAAANTFKYNKAGNQDVKGGTYRTIEFGGSGIKTLLGNVVVNVTGGGGQSTTGTASVNLNGFTITTI